MSGSTVPRPLSTSHNLHGAQPRIALLRGLQKVKEDLKLSSRPEAMSKDKLEGLVKRMEVTLSEMEQLKHHCGRQSEELSQLVVELRRENQELTEKYNQLALDMKEAKEIIEQLQDTKYAFDAKERQAQKLSRQL
ncbi:hypothetical protein SRHO_G00137650 [Serrasalmus rhombeus]